MIIIGIDPGTTKAGFGVIKKTKKGVECLDYGIIMVDSSLSHEERLKVIYREVSKLLNKYKPKFLAVERLYFFKNLKTFVFVSEARGVILLAAVKKKVEIKGFAPLQVKLGICGYGRASKEQVQKKVKTILKLKKLPEPDDAADALAVAIYSSRCLPRAKSKVLARGRRCR